MSRPETRPLPLFAPNCPPDAHEEALPAEPPSPARDTEIKAVWRAWQGRQKNPDRVKLTPERRKLLAARLAGGYAADALALMIRWAYEADEPGPRFLRGENDRGQTYLDLENLLRTSKIQPRIEAATAWAEARAAGLPRATPNPTPADPRRAALPPAPPAPAFTDASGGVSWGALGGFRGGRR